MNEITEFMYEYQEIIGVVVLILSLYGLGMGLWFTDMFEKQEEPVTTRQRCAAFFFMGPIPWIGGPILLIIFELIFGFFACINYIVRELK